MTMTCGCNSEVLGHGGHLGLCAANTSCGHKIHPAVVIMLHMLASQVHVRSFARLMGYRKWPLKVCMLVSHQFSKIITGQAGIQKLNLWKLFYQDFLQAGCPSCHPTNIIKALKDYTCIFLCKHG